MASDLLYLNELDSNSHTYRVKVKVLEKHRPKESSKKGTVYQRLILVDDKGHKMSVALFGDQVKAFKEALLYNGEYIISNAPIKRIEEQWRSNRSELPYQMTFGGRAMVQPVDTATVTLQMQYTTISAIPRVLDTESKYDVLAIVLYVEEETRKVTTAQGRELCVREVVDTDQTNDQPITISLWNDLAVSICNPLKDWAQVFNVFAFTALRPSLHKGFSLSSSMSTEILHEPKGDRTNVLKEWARLYCQKLLDRQARLLAIRYPEPDNNVMKIQELQEKKACNALLEERHWIKTIIQDPSIDNVTSYVGCMNCGKRTTAEVNEEFACDTCHKKDSVACYRVVFRFEAIDHTGRMEFTTFNDDTEKLFCRDASEIHRIKSSGEPSDFWSIQFCLRTAPMSIKVGPTSALATNNVLQWSLKAIDIEDDYSSTPNHTLYKEQIEKAMADQPSLAELYEYALMNEERITEHVAAHARKPVSKVLKVQSEVCVPNNTEEQIPGDVATKNQSLPKNDDATNKPHLMTATVVSKEVQHAGVLSPLHLSNSQQKQLKNQVVPMKQQDSAVKQELVADNNPKENEEKLKRKLSVTVSPSSPAGGISHKLPTGDV